MELLKLPFVNALEGAQNILLAGAGGGYHIFCGLPLYFSLRNAGKKVHLANLSFSNLYGSTAERLLDDRLVEVTATTRGREDYFPELHLARWLELVRREKVPIYCIGHLGAKPIFEAYQWLAEYLQVDAIVLVDGGTDSLMRGDETDLGTPEEDAASLAAVHQLNIPTKLLVCLGFGIDGICHAQFLEAVAEITKNNGFLGAWTLTRDMLEVQLYQAAAEAVFAAMPKSPSIISASVLSALNGQFGDHHATYRTEGSELFINPLMTLYWCFKLDKVAERILYLNEIRDTETHWELTTAIAKFRDNLEEVKRWVSLPM